jgi:hypothetical protein
LICTKLLKPLTAYVEPEQDTYQKEIVAGGHLVFEERDVLASVEDTYGGHVWEGLREIREFA